MTIAYTVWTWLLDPFNNFKSAETKELQRVQFKKAAQEISFLGYSGIENFNIIVETFEYDVDDLQAILDEHALTLTAVYTYLKTDFENEKKMAERCLKLMNAVGCNTLNLQAPKKSPAGTTKDDVLETARKVNIIGNMAYDHGVNLCFHPHWGSTVETEEEIAILMEHTNAEHVHLCLDTAHTQLLGMDSSQMIERYFDRIRYIHFKDVDPDVTVDLVKPMHRFCALGQGTVDFKGIYKTLKTLGYDGTICVELDYPKVCNFQSAQASRRYLYETIGI